MKETDNSNSSIHLFEDIRLELMESVGLNHSTAGTVILHVLKSAEKDFKGILIAAEDQLRADEEFENLLISETSVDNISQSMFSGDTPYEICEAYSKGTISQEQLLGELKLFPYTAEQDFAQNPTVPGGTWNHIVKASKDGLLDPETFLEICKNSQDRDHNLYKLGKEYGS